MGEEFEAPKKILELNPRHVIIAGVSQMLAEDHAEERDDGSPEDAPVMDVAIVDASIEQLYDNALLLEGLHPNPTDMVERIQLLMASAVTPHKAE